MANTTRRQEPAGWDVFNRDLFRDLLQCDALRTWAFPVQAVMPTFDVKETNEALVIQGDLPGMSENDLQISLSGNRLTISGERKAEEKHEGENDDAFERRYGTFVRSFVVPDEVDTDHVRGELTDGVLKLTLPKRADSKPRRMPLAKGK